MTFVFVTVILGATGPGSTPGLAGLALGLTLAAIDLVGINVKRWADCPSYGFTP